MEFPAEEKVYSVNDARISNTDPAIAAFLESCRKKGMTARYTGALVADFHRNLIQGGVYLYPGSYDKPEGKLRMLYEAQPLAFLAHQAGGATWCHHHDLLDVTPTSLHQRTPLFTGHASSISRLRSMIAASAHPVPEPAGVRVLR